MATVERAVDVPYAQGNPSYVRVYDHDGQNFIVTLRTGLGVEANIHLTETGVREMALALQAAVVGR